MANTIKTLKDGDITRRALSIFHNNLVFCNSINKQYDDRFAKSGAKNGGELVIRNPNQFTVRTGAVMDSQDVTENTQTMVVATQKGVDINFSSAELTLSLDDFSARILEPAMSRLAADVEKSVLDNVYPYVYKTANTTHGTKPVLADIQTARAKLQQGLAPRSDRYLMTEALAANSIINDTKALFHAGSEIAGQYKTGMLGTLMGFVCMESEMTPIHTCGSRTDTTPVCDISSIANGDESIAITAGASSGVYAVGDVFTLADVYEVNPETKVSTGVLKQFSVKTAVTASGGGATIAITEAIYKDGARQNAYAAAWTGSKAMTNQGAAGSGVASTSYAQGLAYHRDAFTFATADLEMPKGVDMAYRAVFDGISMRLVRNFDITNDKFPCRIDVLFGSKCVRPQWACRVTS